MGWLLTVVAGTRWGSGGKPTGGVVGNGGVFGYITPLIYANLREEGSVT